MTTDIEDNNYSLPKEEVDEETRAPGEFSV